MSGPKQNGKDAPETPQQRGVMAGPRGGHGPGAMGGFEKAKDAKSALFRLLKYLGDYKLHLGIVGILTIVSSLLSLAGPYLIGLIIDKAIIQRNVDELIRLSLLLIVTYIFSTLISITSGWVMAIISQRSLKKLRRELFEHIQTLSIGFFDSRQSGDLMSRLTNDVDSIGQAISQNVTTLISSSITLVGVAVMMFVLNFYLALASLILFPLMVLITAWIGKKTRAEFRDLMMDMGLLNSVMQETISGQRVVIAFEQQESVNKKFTSLNNNVKEVSIKAMTYSMLIMPLMNILSHANIALVAGLGGWMVLQEMATVGLIASFITYTNRFTEPLRQFANIYNSIQSALAGAERIFEVIDTKSEFLEESEAIKVKEFVGDVEFKDVDFEYVSNVPVLKDITFKAEHGKIIALVGPTGAGKTTIVNLLSRFYDIKDGSITIDGNDIKYISKDDLRRRLGIVLQDVFLFSGTVMDNIRYGRLDATDEECIEAAKLANADGFIRRLPKGYYTELSERAGNLSQGQKQLISIARALVADPDILILDEATSSVDSRTEVHIQEAFQRLMHGRTNFVIAHRLSTIRKADLVLVINNGELIERGTHEELLAKKGFYYRLYMSQFKGTNGEAALAKINTEETSVPITPPIGMPNMMGEQRMAGNPAMFMDRIMQTVNRFKDKDATTPENAKTIEELGLPPSFKMMITYSPMGQLGLFNEVNGKYYLQEDKLKQTLTRFNN